MQKGWIEIIPSIQPFLFDINLLNPYIVLRNSWFELLNRRFNVWMMHIIWYKRCTSFTMKDVHHFYLRNFIFWFVGRTHRYAYPFYLYCKYTENNWIKQKKATFIWIAFCGIYWLVRILLLRLLVQYVVCFLTWFLQYHILYKQSFQMNMHRQSP